MTTSWRFTDLEFVVLWEELKEDGLPVPFAFTARSPFYDEYLREKQEIRERLRSVVDAGFGSVLETVARRDIRVSALGWSGRDPADPEGVVRLLGVRQGERAFLVTQLPGETVWHSGGYTITECDVVSLAAALVAALPDSPAGRLGEIALETQVTPGSEMDYSFGRRVAHEWSDDADGHRSAQFRRATVTRAGVIEISQGRSLFGPRGVVRRRIGWRDLAEDGRYAVRDDNPPIAAGVDAKRLTAMINSEIAEIVRVIKDERV